MKNKFFFVILTVLALLHLALLIPAFRNISHFKLQDSYQYLQLAQNILHQGKYTGQAASDLDLVRPPVYPVFLAAGLLLGQDGQWIPLLQTLILFATAYILYRIGNDLGNETIGKIASILYLFNPNAAFWATTILTETLAAFWLGMSFWMLVRFGKTYKYSYLAASGMLLGLAALTRPIVYPLIFILAIILFLFWWFQHKEKISRVLVIKRVVVFLSAGLILVFPWQVRNLVVHNDFTLSTVDNSTFQDWMVGKSIAEMKNITREQAVAEIAASPDPLRYSLEFIAEHPIPFIKTQVRGLFRVLLGSEYGTWAQVLGNQTIETTGMLANFNLAVIWRIVSSGSIWVWAGIYALLYDAILYGLCVTALIVITLRNKNALKNPLLMLLVIIIGYMIVIPGPAGESRFRVPVDPLLALFAGFTFSSSNKR